MARSLFVADAVSRDSGCLPARSRFVADVADAKQARDQDYLKARSRFVADAADAKQARDQDYLKARSRFVADAADAKFFAKGKPSLNH